MFHPTPQLCCCGCCRLGVTSPCSQPGLPAWHIGYGMLPNGASNDSCWFYKEAENHSSNRQWRFLQPWLPKHCGTHSHSKHHPCTGILLLLGLACCQPCSSLPGCAAIWRRNFFRPTFGCLFLLPAIHKNSCQHISRRSSRQHIQCSHPDGD